MKLRIGGRASHQHVGGKTKDKLIIEPDMIRDTSERVELIRRRIRTAQDRQKSYADKRRTDLEFKIGDMVFVKISPLRNMVR